MDKNLLKDDEIETSKGIFNLVDSHPRIILCVVVLLTIICIMLIVKFLTLPTKEPLKCDNNLEDEETIDNLIEQIEKKKENED